jgi:hypothetical protein
VGARLELPPAGPRESCRRQAPAESTGEAERLAAVEGGAISAAQRLGAVATLAGRKGRA